MFEVLKKVDLIYAKVFDLSIDLSMERSD